MAPKAATRTYEATRDDTFAAVERAVAGVGMKVKQVDPERGLVSATTGATIRSWGERVDVAVAEVTPTSTEVTVSIALKFQVFGWGQQARVAEGLLDEIGRRLKPGLFG